MAVDLSLDERLSAERLRELERDPEALAALVREQLELALAARTPNQLEGVKQGPTSSKAQLMRPKLLELRGRVDALVVAQRQLLEDMAIQELDGQRQQAENYLIEARFAVARLYDTDEVAN